MAARDVKVGIFVFASLIILGVVIFLIGDERRLFETHADLKTTFQDVQGLSRGSPVRMGGVDIGRVTSLGFGDNATDDTIFVHMTIVEEEARRIRKDSVAKVEGKGFLGDKMIVITVGSPSSPVVTEGEVIRSEESQDFAQIITDLKSTAAGAERVIVNLEKTTKAFSEETFTGDVQSAVNHLSEILETMNKGEGYVGRLLNDPAEAENLSTTVASLRGSAVELEELLRSSRAVVDRVKTGPGLVHQVIYEKDGEKAIAQIGGAADELALALRGVRQGDSFAHDMLYEEKSAALLDNLNQASAEVAAMTADVRQGKGTLGAFLVDPSVYEDIKVLLGNVGRNRSLRALVRYSIRQDEKSGRVVDPQAKTTSASTSAP